MQGDIDKHTNRRINTPLSRQDRPRGQKVKGLKTLMNKIDHMCVCVCMYVRISNFIPW